MPSPVQSALLTMMGEGGWELQRGPLGTWLHRDGEINRLVKTTTFESLRDNGWIEVTRQLAVLNGEPVALNTYGLTAAGKQVRYLAMRKGAKAWKRSSCF
jgi:hypothetical protein